MSFTKQQDKKSRQEQMLDSNNPRDGRDQDESFINSRCSEENTATPVSTKRHSMPKGFGE